MQLLQALVLILPLTLTAVSCAAIGGLADYHEVDCVGGCEAGATADAGSDAVGTDAARVSLPFVSIGGTVAGLAGTGLILKNNGADHLQISTNGGFSFPASVRNEEPYDVTIGSQPTSPAQVCAVADGAGRVHGMDITNVAVTCATSTYGVGGIVVGLNGSGLVLTLNAAAELPVAANGAFLFPAKVASGAPFNVGIKTQPLSSGPCSVSGASGTVGLANITSVVVNCAPGTYTVGGTATGLDGTVVLQNNGASDLSVTSNGSFAFAQALSPGTSYAVTVLSAPSYPPRSQACTVQNGSGSVSSANVTQVAVACATRAFAVGGSVSGLAGTLVLKNNGGDALTLNASGAFAFPTAVLSGTTYSATIATQPAGQTCSINNATGTVANAPVTTVSLTCQGTTGDPGIYCGATYCDPATSVCCITSGVPACSAKCVGGDSAPIACDDARDCTSGRVCCASLNGASVNNVFCTSLALCTAPKVIFCDPALANTCPNGGACIPSAVTGYYQCF